MAAPTDKRVFYKRSQQKFVWISGVRNSITLDVEGVRNLNLGRTKKKRCPRTALFILFHLALSDRASQRRVLLASGLAHRASRKC